MSSALPREPPRVPPVLFWAILGSTVGVWGAQSFAWLLGGRPAELAISDAGLLYLVASELLIASIWWPILRRRGWSLEVVTVPPGAAEPLRGLLLYVAWFLAYWAFYNLVHLVAPGFTRQASEWMRVGGSASWAPVIALSIVNPVVEEFLYLGFLANVLRRHGNAVALSASLLARVVVHVYQGPLGALSNVPFGLILGGFYLSDRRLWPAVIAHGIADLVALGRMVGA